MDTSKLRRNAPEGEVFRGYPPSSDKLYLSSGSFSSRVQCEPDLGSDLVTIKDLRDELGVMGRCAESIECLKNDQSRRRVVRWLWEVYGE